jgi:UPF0755 protein
VRKIQSIKYFHFFFVRKFLLFSGVLTLCIIGAFFFLSYQVTSSHGAFLGEKTFEVRPGENALVLGERLQEEKLISSRFAFAWYLLRQNKLHTLIAGTYNLSGRLTIPEIALFITEGDVVSHDIKVTFPEGFTAKKMAARLTANKLPGDKFLYLVEHPLPQWRTQFDFLSDLPEKATLEGYLFPDTYLFNPEASGQTIIETLLKNFGKKVDGELRMALKQKTKTLFGAVTLASIVEQEVQSESDRKKVSDIFLRRLAIGQALQSDATLKYILGLDKIQHSVAETRTVSPYNTYMHAGLPPGAVSNPGLVSLRAVAFPESNPYFYFLTDSESGETVFSMTFEEHVRNKALHGL